MGVNEEYLGEYLSVYLGKGSFWSHTVHGVYVTKNRIMVVPFGWKYFTISYASFIIGIGISLATLYSFIGTPTGNSLWFLLVGYGALLSVLAANWSAASVEVKLRHRKPSTMKEVQLKKYFEARKDQISEIIMKKGTAFRPGSLMINLREGRPFKITFFGPSDDNENRFYQLMQLIELFCMKPFVIRPSNLFVWTL